MIEPEKINRLLEVIQPNPAAPKQYHIIQDKETITIHAKITTERERVCILEQTLDEITTMGLKLTYIVGDHGYLVLKFKQVRVESEK